MSWEHIIAARDRRDLAAGPKHVLLTLATYSNGQGLAWPSPDTLAYDTSFTPQHVRAQLHKLVAAGVIERLAGPAWPPVYDLGILVAADRKAAKIGTGTAKIGSAAAKIGSAPIREQTRNIYEQGAVAAEPVESVPLPAWAARVLNRHLTDIQLSLEV